MSSCRKCWPDRNQLTGPVKAFWGDTTLLPTHRGLLLRGSRLLIPTAMPNSVLKARTSGRAGAESGPEKRCGAGFERPVKPTGE